MPDVEVDRLAAVRLREPLPPPRHDPDTHTQRVSDDEVLQLAAVDPDAGVGRAGDVGLELLPVGREADNTVPHVEHVAHGAGSGRRHDWGLTGRVQESCVVGPRPGRTACGIWAGLLIARAWTASGRRSGWASGGGPSATPRPVFQCESELSP